MEMVEIRFMNERVSPTGPEKKKDISGEASGNKNLLTWST